MLKMRKLLAGLLTGAMLLGLSACGGDSQVVQSGVQPTRWQSVAEVESLELALDEENGDYPAQVPMFVNEEASLTLVALNEQLQNKIDEYRATELADNLVMEIVPLVVETPNYLSVVLYEQEIPSYGTDGEASVYVYDKVTNSIVEEDLAWSLASATDDGIGDAIKAYCEKVLNQDGQDWRWLAFSNQGYYMDSDGKMAVIVSVSIKPKGEDTEVWDYLLVYKGGEIIGRLSDDAAQMK